MRRAFSLISMLMGLSAITPAWAASPTVPPDSHNDLMSAAFAAPRASFTAPPSASSFDAAHPLQPTAYVDGKGPVRWGSEEIRLSADRGAVDTVRLAVASTPVGPAIHPGPGGPYEATGYDISYSRGWPAAFKFNAGNYDLAVSPHAGVGMSNAGGSAEAGAMLKVEPGKKSVEDRLGDLGVQDGRKFGDQGRWYLFAAVSGKAVGLNMTQGEGGGWDRSGWSVDRTSALIGDGQVGVGWRQGAMQASFGYVHREIKVQNAPYGQDNDVQDSMAAFSLSIRPSW